MLPTSYVCTNCREQFKLVQREARYFFDADADAASPGRRISGADLFDVPVRPAWCKHCDAVCLVEDIAPTRAFEDAYGATRAGRAVEYPIATAWLDAQQVRDDIASYLRWRMGRRHAARALCCGRTDFQFLDVAQPLFKHAECDFGFIEQQFMVGGYNGRGPGVYRSADIRVYSGEGVLIGLLTWRDPSSRTWEMIPAAYAVVDED